jgi:hypothetical protein
LIIWLDVCPVRSATHVSVLPFASDSVNLRDRGSGRFAGLQLVPALLSAAASDRIDMSAPRRLKGYDKRGYEIFLADMKDILFVSKNRKRAKVLYFDGTGMCPTLGNALLRTETAFPRFTPRRRWVHLLRSLHCGPSGCLPPNSRCIWASKEPSNNVLVDSIRSI